MSTHVSARSFIVFLSSVYLPALLGVEETLVAVAGCGEAEGREDRQSCPDMTLLLYLLAGPSQLLLLWGP